MKLILVGPPGAGKGTQATFISERYGIPHISTGAIFRSHMSEGTELGQLASEYINDGKLVPDAVTDAMVEHRLAEPDAAAGYLLDGYPRNIHQVDALDRLGEEADAVVEINVPDSEILGRLRKRAEIEGRADDTEDVIAERIVGYHDQTTPVIKAYSERGKLISVAGIGSIEEVKQAVFVAIDEFLAR